MSNPPTVGEGRPMFVGNWLQGVMRDFVSAPLDGHEALGSSSPKSEDTHRAADGLVVARPTAVRLEGRMDGPNPMMRVIIERADGTESEIIQDNGTIISHWARIP